jgi:hypothetical protein
MSDSIPEVLLPASATGTEQPETASKSEDTQAVISEEQLQVLPPPQPPPPLPPHHLPPSLPSPPLQSQILDQTSISFFNAMFLS